MSKAIQSSNSSQIKSTHALEAMMQQVLDLAKKKGATDASVSIQKEDGLSVDVRMSEIETLAFHEAQEISITAYLGHRQGTASSTDVSIAALGAMVDAAISIARVSADDPCFGLADKDLVDNSSQDLSLYHPWTLDAEGAIERALRCEQLALTSDDRITNSDGTSLSSYAVYHGFADTLGRHLILKSTHHGMSCSLIAEQGKSMQRDYEYTGARHFDALLTEDVLAKKAAKRVVARLGAKKIKTFQGPVLFDSRISSGLFASLISAISGMNIYRKNSFLLDALGERVFPENISVYEQPHLKRALGSATHDSEGVPTRANQLIENGVLNQWVLSSYSARKLGLASTANSGGVFNLTVEPTSDDLDSMLKQLDTGLYVTELMGQGVNILTGDYSRGACGFWVENGEIQYPVEEITIAGNLRQMFMGIQAVGSDINPNSATRCGSVLIDSMVISGE